MKSKENNSADSTLPIEYLELASAIAISQINKINCEQDKYIRSITPKWWRWCIKKGGIFRWAASKFIKVIIVEKTK